MPQPQSASVARRRGKGPRPGSIFCAYVYKSYAARSLIVAFGLVDFALAFDLAKWLPNILDSHHQDSTLALAELLGWYVALRSVDRLADLLPLVGFLGVLWSELAHTVLGERTAIHAIGRSWRDYVMPAVLFAATLAVFQFSLMSFLRPEAAGAQARDRLGQYIQVLVPGAQTGPIWLAAGGDLITARVEFGPPLRMLDVMRYAVGSGRLRQITTAAEATPAARPGYWRFHDGTLLTLESEEPGYDPQNFTNIEVPLAVNPLWLAAFGISGPYVPQATLSRLAAADLPPELAAEYRTVWQSRLAIPVLSAGLVMLAAALSWTFLADRIRLSVLLRCGLLGYVVHAAGRQILVVGEHGHIAADLAAWLTPCALLCGLLAAALYALWRERKRIAARLAGSVVADDEMLAQGRSADGVASEHFGVQ